MSLSFRRKSRQSDATKVRKISLQNDYAFGIISPVSPSTLPISIPLRRGVSDESQIPCIVVSHFQIEPKLSSDYDPNDPNMPDVGVDPLCSSMAKSTTERFRRWSFSNFQSAYQETAPSGTETNGQFTSDEDVSKNMLGSCVGLSGRFSRDDGYEHLDNWISGFITKIPDRIRKISAERKPDANNIYSPDEELKKQLQKVYVY